MECPNCSGQMGLEDEFCPYCGTPNAMARKHQSDMAHFRQEYQRTQADVMRRTSMMQRHGSWLVILLVLVVALVAGFVLHVVAWDIGYSIRTNSVERSIAEDREVLDAYLEQGDYGKFLGYYDANNISLDYDNPYEGVHRAARAYTDLIQYVSALHNETDYAFRPEYVSSTCEHLADDLIRIYSLEQEYRNNMDRYLPADKRVYVEDIRERAGVIAKAYFGLTDEQVRQIPDMSTKKLAAVIEEGIVS